MTIWRLVQSYRGFGEATFVIFITMDRKEFWVLIKHCFLMEKNTVEAKQWLDKRYKDSARGKSTIIGWYVEFKRGRTNTDNAERSDRKLKLREIADTLKISEGSVFTILHESLGSRKLFSKWVPHFLTPDQKQQRVEDSERCLKLFKRGKKDFLRRYMTIDETWIHHYTPETRRSSAEWKAAGENRPKRPKTQQWAGKVMASLFWDAHRILFIDYLEKGKTINNEYYMALLNWLRAKIKKKWPHMQKKNVLFHQDNAPCHESIKTMVKLNELSFGLLPHPPYAPDLAFNKY